MGLDGQDVSFLSEPIVGLHEISGPGMISPTQVNLGAEALKVQHTLPLFSASAWQLSQRSDSCVPDPLEASSGLSYKKQHTLAASSQALSSIRLSPRLPSWGKLKMAMENDDIDQTTGWLGHFVRSTLFNFAIALLICLNTIIMGALSDVECVFYMDADNKGEPTGTFFDVLTLSETVF